MVQSNQTMPQFQPGNQLAKTRLYVTELISRKLDIQMSHRAAPKVELVNALFKLAMGTRLLKGGRLFQKTEPNFKAIQEIINRCEGKVPVRINGTRDNQDLLEVIERVVISERVRANGGNGHIIDITPEAAEEAED